jgi:hypothetical protein
MISDIQLSAVSQSAVKMMLAADVMSRPVAARIFNVVLANEKYFSAFSYV